MRIILATAVAASALLLSIATGGAQSPSPTAGNAPPTPARTANAPTPAPYAANSQGRASQVPANGPPIVIEAGKGTLIRLPRPANTVFVANPDVADVQVKSPC